MKFEFNHSYKQCLNELAQVFQKNNFELFLVGGTLRDALLGVESKDIDLATNATPDAIERLIKHTKATGKHFGTITALIAYKNQNIPMQITTYRHDGHYSDKRHPDDVVFEHSINIDVKRRDFTVNALAYDILNDVLLDYVGGSSDLANKILRVVGNPMQRFQEDSLRLFRCCRFLAQLEFSCEQNTWDALCSLASHIRLPSKERITSEVLGILNAKKASRGILALCHSGLAQRIFPGLSDQSDTAIIRCDEYDADMRLAYLLKDLDVTQCFESLCLSNHDKHWIKALIKHDFDRKKALFKKTDLALSGQEIMDLGFQGKYIGMIQQHCYDFVLNDLSKNTKEILTAFIKTLKLTA